MLKKRGLMRDGVGAQVTRRAAFFMSLPARIA
jgi:hypothetical protein